MLHTIYVKRSTGQVHRYFATKVSTTRSTVTAKRAKDQDIGSEHLKYPCMVRDFVKDRLYAADEGYFHRQETQVGTLKSQIEFSKLLGKYLILNL